ncbi:MAG: hypothetical protein DWH91_11965 [Planctomycetota bacterium]|nr:MAG: hypothetical protein DWH91_11965 [Planctomycetota bacterium]
MRRTSENPLLRFFHGMFRRHLPLESETSVFILVNVLDFVTTYWMLSHRESGHGSFYESNPVARFFLHHWGVRGLLMFKMGVVAFVCVIAQIVATRRESSARFLLIVGTIIVAAVVIYSWRLFLGG